MEHFYCFETKKWYESGAAAARELGMEKIWHVYKVQILLRPDIGLIMNIIFKRRGYRKIYGDD